MANAIYNSFKRDIMNGSIDLDTNSFKVALVRSAYSPNIDSHTKFSNITNEITGDTGYTAGGRALSGLSVSQDNGGDEGVWDAADVIWASSSLSAYGAVVYKDSGVASTSPLVCYFDFGSYQVSSSGTFTISWNAEGIINLN